jgi:hypothetical protein
MKTIKRQLMAYLAATLLLGILLTGCSSKSEDSSSAAAGGKAGTQTGGQNATGTQAAGGSQGLKAPPAPP